ncbi:HpcH/HpaI aldolase/citrate lyase family protein [Bordetella hinzii]|nr:aldolase/citrate lyase family protein [Bordetella hinzii]
MSRPCRAIWTSWKCAKGCLRLLPIVTETAAATLRAAQYEAGGRLDGLMWGGEDLAADLGAQANRDASGRYTAPYEMARSLALLGAAAARVPAIDAVYPDFRDLQGLRAEALDALRDGFSAKAAIHPAQVAVINEAFTPAPQALRQAERVLRAFQEAGGAAVVALDGKMLDRPHYRAARRVLERAAGKA